MKEVFLLELVEENKEVAKSILTGGFEIGRPGAAQNPRETLQKSLDNDNQLFLGELFDSFFNPARNQDVNGDNFGGDNNKGTHGEEFHDDAEEVPEKVEVVTRSLSQEDLLFKALFDLDRIEKAKPAGGPGSRGGKVIGTTSSGKPIYANANNRNHKNFDAKDHHEAYAAHWRLAEHAIQNRDNKARQHHSDQQAAHKTKWQAHEQLGAKIPEFSESASKVQLAKSELDEVFDLLKSRYTGLPKKAGGKIPKAPKDPVQRAQEKEQRREMGLEKADDDSIIETVPEKPVKNLAKLHENSPSVLEKKKKCGFVKAAGPGGVVFDFGKSTGNTIADNATAILNQFADPMQENNAQYQAESYQQALQEYVTKGEEGFTKGRTPFSNIQGGDQLDKSNDQQVKEAFEKGILYQDTNAPAVKNDFNKTEMTLGNQLIKATSETDAALIEMMSRHGNTSSDDGFVADATAPSGLVSITAGE